MIAQFPVLPNSVKNYLVVKPSGPKDRHVIFTVFSQEGLVLKECEFFHPNSNGEYVVDVRGLARGEYYLLINSDKENRIERFNIL